MAGLESNFFKMHALKIPSREGKVVVCFLLAMLLISFGIYTHC